MAELPFAFSSSAAIPAPPLPPPPPSAPLAPSQTEERPAGILAGSEQPQTLEAIVRIAFDNDYSDIHIGIGEIPRFRCLGDMVTSKWPVTDAVQFRQWLREILDPGQLDDFKRDKDFDGSYAFGFVRIRINLLETLLGSAMVLRLIPQQIRTIESLGLPRVLIDLASRPKGLLLVTGSTGTGKSTTLAALIDYINCSMRRHVLTIEDPLEFVHESQQSLVRQRQVGSHTKGFQSALRAALREDPDVILIGEIRDQETLITAIKASQTGHLVLGTLHTSSAVRSVERVIGMFPSQEQESVRRALADALLAVISQGLVKTTDGKRVAFHDIFINTDSCRDYIVTGKLDEIEAIMARSAFEGMQTSNQSLARLVEEGRATVDEVMGQSLRPNELAQTLRGRT